MKVRLLMGVAGLVHLHGILLICGRMILLGCRDGALSRENPDWENRVSGRQS